MNHQEAHELRDEIAQAIHDWRCLRDCIGYDNHFQGTKDFYLNEAEAVLPIVTRREAELRERLELAEENTAEGADEAVRQAQTMAFTAQRNLAAIEIERDQLIAKINALADEWESKDSALPFGVRAIFEDCAARLRGLVSGDNQAQR